MMMVPSPILLICAGNICRSPFAEAYFRKQFEAAGAEAEAFSRGLLNLPNQRVPKVAQEVAATEFDIDLAPHVSQPLLSTDLDRAGMVLVMNPEQRQHLSKKRPACIAKVFILSQLTGGKPIRDPMNENREVFFQVYTEIARNIDVWTQRFGLPPAPR